ncbi:unnamed protein product [Amoebophrya sp. A120]|nr:unnamed protein product [Amoebophrya sp. A120]|eukprot:GSA120T00000884001.1
MDILDGANGKLFSSLAQLVHFVCGGVCGSAFSGSGAHSVLRGDRRNYGAIKWSETVERRLFSHDLNKGARLMTSEPALPSDNKQGPAASEEQHGWSTEDGRHNTATGNFGSGNGNKVVLDFYSLNGEVLRVENVERFLVPEGFGVGSVKEEAPCSNKASGAAKKRKEMLEENTETDTKHDQAEPKGVIDVGKLKAWLLAEWNAKRQEQIGWFAGSFGDVINTDQHHQSSLVRSHFSPEGLGTTRMTNTARGAGGELGAIGASSSSSAGVVSTFLQNSTYLTGNWRVDLVLPTDVSTRRTSSPAKNAMNEEGEVEAIGGKNTKNTHRDEDQDEDGIINVDLQQQKSFISLNRFNCTRLKMLPSSCTFGDRRTGIITSGSAGREAKIDVPVPTTLSRPDEDDTRIRNYSEPDAENDAPVGFFFEQQRRPGSTEEDDLSYSEPRPDDISSAATTPRGEDAPQQHMGRRQAKASPRQGVEEEGAVHNNSNASPNFFVIKQFPERSAQVSKLLETVKTHYESGGEYTVRVFEHHGFEESLRVLEQFSHARAFEHRHKLTSLLWAHGECSGQLLQILSMHDSLDTVILEGDGVLDSTTKTTEEEHSSASSSFYGSRQELEDLFTQLSIACTETRHSVALMSADTRHFAKFLAHNLSSLQALALNTKGLTDTFAKTLACFLPTSVLQTVSLAGNRIGDLGLAFLAVALAQNGVALKSLSLGQNAFSDDGVQSLAFALLKAEKLNLQYVSLLGTSAGSEWNAAGRATNKRPPGRGITDQGCFALARVLKQNTSLTFLDLADHVFITRAGATALATAVAGNRQRTSLEDIRVTVAGENNPDVRTKAELLDCYGPW